MNDGDTTAFTITPIAPYVIDTVTGCGGNLQDNIYTTGPITDDCTVTATFSEGTTDVIFADGFDGTTP